MEKTKSWGTFSETVKMNSRSERLVASAQPKVSVDCGPATNGSRQRYCITPGQRHPSFAGRGVVPSSGDPGASHARGQSTHRPDPPTRARSRAPAASNSSRAAEIQWPYVTINLCGNQPVRRVATRTRRKFDFRTAIDSSRVCALQ